MDYQALNFWLHAIEMLGIVAIAVFQFFGARSRVTAEAFASLREHIDKSIAKVEADMDQRHQHNVTRITSVEGDLQRIEGEQKHAPNHDDLKRVHTRLDDFGGKLSELIGEQKASNRTLELIHDYMLNGGKR